MLTKAELKTIISDNFADPRITSIALFITKLLERKKHGGGVNQYRLKNTLTDSYITTLADFLTAIDADTLDMDYYRSSDKMTGDRTHPFIVRLGNIKVELQKFTDEDAVYYSTYGESTQICFLMNYLSDGDTVLPLKIFEVKLS